MPAPQLWIVAGPNGAGKTTCTQTKPISAILPHVQLLNPDTRTKEFLLARGFAGFADTPDDVLLDLFRQAAAEVESELVAALARSEAVGVETVLSTNKYQGVVGEVRRRGGSFNLIYVTVFSPDIAVARVAIRVSRGGHGVPPQKVIDRYYRSHLNLKWFASSADNFWVIDNSGSDPTVPPSMPAFGNTGRLEFFDPSASGILKDVLSTLPSV